MLLTAETTEDGQRRVYFTSHASVVTYFANDETGDTMASAHPGDFASPYVTTPAICEAVRQAMLEEAARRLHCRLDQVLTYSLTDIELIADPIPRQRHHWAGRAKGKRPAFR
jgi:hypothetical protein